MNGQAYSNKQKREELIIEARQAVLKEISEGNLLSSKNKFNEAIFSYKRALELKPVYFKAYNNLGITYQRLNKLEMAMEKLQKAINYNKDYPDAYIKLSNVDKVLRQDETELYPVAELMPQ